MNLSRAWARQAANWGKFARTPGLDHHFWWLNMPRFVELLPPPGRATVDLGCGEGRLGRILVDGGHRVTGVELQPALARLAREHHEVVEADAAALPFADGSFDLAIAFMSLHDMDDMEGAVREAARVLEPAGHFCIAVEHPLQKAGSFDDPDDPESAFTITGSYFAPRRDAPSIDRDGLTLTLHSIYRPLAAYARALEDAGLLIEAVREPVPDAEFVASRPRVAKWTRIPIFLHVRALKPSGGRRTLFP